MSGRDVQATSRLASGNLFSPSFLQMDGQGDDGGHLDSCVLERLGSPSLHNSNPGRAMGRIENLRSKPLNLGNSLVTAPQPTLIIWWLSSKDLRVIDPRE